MAKQKTKKSKDSNSNSNHSFEQTLWAAADKLRSWHGCGRLQALFDRQYGGSADPGLLRPNRHRDYGAGFVTSMRTAGNQWKRQRVSGRGSVMAMNKTTSRKETAAPRVCVARCADS